MGHQFKDFFFSFPLQLFLLHLRSNLLLLGLWLVCLFFISGNLGYNLGFQYLFLDPEYLGVVNFWSFFFVGLAFGGFFMTWNLTIYLLTAHHFPFLASLSRPFTKFCINNLILPLLFFGYFIGKLIHFERSFEEQSWLGILTNCAGLVAGASFLILIFAFYFQLTNRDISHFEQKEEGERNKKNLPPGRPGIDLDFVKLDVNRLPVQTYLTERFRPRLVRSVAHYESDLLLSIFRQNHLNALVIQLISLVGLMFLGWLIDFPAFQIPAAASILILFSVVAAIIGAITYWFHAWRSTLIILLLVFINFATSFKEFGHVNRAYGLDYTAPPTPYSLNKLNQISNPAQIARDSLQTIQILNRWKEKVTPLVNRKPRLVLIAVSGGGLRSVTWTMHVMQTADRMLDGNLIRHTGLITGASGGIMGMSYYRELWLQEQKGTGQSRFDPEHLDRITQDLLNPIAFTLVTNDLFLPWGRFEVNGRTYRKDRGYVFEETLNENTDFLLDKPLAYYREPERNAEIPLLFVTPSIVNDARRLIISPQGVTYMMVTPMVRSLTSQPDVDAVDFRRLFKGQDADQLRFLSALRMNATYPYVLPTVHLPSSPGIEVMDAGFRDNFGLLSATRFIQVFKEWILEHTSGVVLVQINSSEQTIEIEASDKQGFVESLVNPLGIATQVLDVQEFEQDNAIGFINDILGPDHFEFVRFRYSPPAGSKVKPSISFHITKREKELVLKALSNPSNQSNLRRLVDLLQP